MARNVVMLGVGLTALLALVLAALEMYVVLSYVAAAHILAVLASAVVERGDSELSLAPYTGILGWLTAIFVAGLTGIWLLWSPGTAEYDYVLGLPSSTLVYFVFIWLLPLAAAVYYSLAFDRIAGDDVVDDILESAREEQEETAFPLAPSGPETPGQADPSGAGGDDDD